MCGKAARRAFRRNRNPAAKPPEPAGGGLPCPGRGRGLRGLARKEPELAGTCRDKRLDF